MVSTYIVFIEYGFMGSLRILSKLLLLVTARKAVESLETAPRLVLGF